VAYRASKKPLAVTLGGLKLPLSNGFALTHHTRWTPKGAKIDFFVLYGHLLPLEDYGDAEAAAPPPLFSTPKLFVATTEDGAGLAVRDGADEGTILGVVPKGAHLDVVAGQTASWNDLAVKVKWGAVE